MATCLHRLYCILSPHRSGVALIFQKQPFLSKTPLACRTTMRLRSVGADAKAEEDEFAEEKGVLSKVAAVYGRRQGFQDFADELLPSHWESRLPHIQAKVDRYAKRLWPDCRVELHGSAARKVHNKHFSDLDFAISNTQGIEDNEFKDFWQDLRRDTEQFKSLRASRECRKSIKLQVLGIPVDVACMDRFVDATLHSRDEIDNLTSFYQDYLGAVRAVRVAKYTFRPLKGLDIEFIAHFLATKRMDLWEYRKQDSEGLDLFQAVVGEIDLYPNGSRNSAIKSLLKRARSQPGVGALQDMNKALTKCQKFASHILELQRTEFSEACFREQDRGLLRPPDLVQELWPEGQATRQSGAGRANSRRSNKKQRANCHCIRVSPPLFFSRCSLRSTAGAARGCRWGCGVVFWSRDWSFVEKLHSTRRSWWPLLKK